MEFFVTNKLYTNNFGKNIRPDIAIKVTDQELATLRDAAYICDNLRCAFDKLEIFDPKEPGICYDNLLSIADLLEDYRIGEKCNEGNY